MSGTKKVAELLKFPVNQAVLFCEQVRMLSRLGTVLSYKIIAARLPENMHESPSQQRVAEIMRVNKSIERLRKQPSQWQPTATRGSGVRHKRIKYSKAPYLPKKIPGPTLYNHERVSGKQLDHCPHGKICAVCDLKKCRELTGID